MLPRGIDSFVGAGDKEAGLSILDPLKGSGAQQLRYMSYSLNFSKGDYIGDYYRGVAQGETRSLDYSSCGFLTLKFTIGLGFAVKAQQLKSKGLVLL